MNTFSYVVFILPRPWRYRVANAIKKKKQQKFCYFINFISMDRYCAE